MKIREFQATWKIPKTEIRENLNTRKLPDLQYIYTCTYPVIIIITLLIQ